MEEFFSTIPPWSKTYLIACVVLAAVSTYGIISPAYYLLIYQQLFRGQIWRLLTAFIYFGDFSINFLFHTLFMITFLPNLEKMYQKKRGDLVVMLVFVMALVLIFSTIVNRHFMMTLQFTEALIYIFCKQQSDVICLLYTSPSPRD
eukprot:TRINITY_DN6412_c0_g4_i3.p1 TRINITY_DN6412_c0_g4~~TRINITY_DN6412_c0_g4_i3.p1  ORF type:complete len:146 (+),score=21.81 TRINITY_DN6412_c0_g4_i3:93-530(+)